MMDQTNTPDASFGVDHVFWNPSVTGQPISPGCYKICVESLEGFYPPLSGSNSVQYSVTVNVEGNVRTFSGGLTADGPISSECVPTGKAPPLLQHGLFVGQFGYPNIDLDFMSDPINCGGCNIRCPATTTCENGLCVGAGELRVSLQWAREGDLDLIVFPPWNNTRVLWSDQGAGSTTAWGRLNQTSEEFGPEVIFWDSSRVIDGQTRPIPVGYYKIVSLSLFLYAFIRKEMEKH